jgi:hypothetical protein
MNSSISLNSKATENDIEVATLQDLSEDFLSPEELNYYLSLDT